MQITEVKFEVLENSILSVFQKLENALISIS